MSNARRRRDAGFTLIEIMVVMVIIGMLMAVIAPNFIRRVGKSQTQAARIQIEALGTALDSFRLDIGRYPSSQEGLPALVQRPFGLDRWDGPYLKKNTVPPDPWNRAYFYRSPGEGGRPYDLYSLGADGAPGGESDNRDVLSWESE
ncbi:MAG: type II secretion system major pseudopilin GspG [Candidatus Binatia bacterium]